MAEFDDCDEYCPHCDNHFIVDAKEPELVVGLDADDPRMNGNFIKDHRARAPNRYLEDMA